MFNASKTSPDPHLEDTALFPCFATLTPILESNNAEAVDILRVFIPSPPVPQQSITFSSIETLVDIFRIARANPTTSAVEIPFSLSKIPASFPVNSSSTLLVSNITK